MSKAILVLKDMPECCDNCNLHKWDDEAAPDLEDLCLATFDRKYPRPIENIFVKPDWCPLKELPSKMGTDDNGLMGAFVAGYNDCLNDILGTEN